MNIIACAAWVKRGVAAAEPDNVQLTAEELEEIIKDAKKDSQDAESDSEDNEEAGTSNSAGKSQNQTTEMEQDEFGIENYDNEAGDIHCSISSVAAINPDGKDPYLTVGEDEDNNSEKEDDIIKPDDNLLLLGHAEEDSSVLEVFVYNEREGSFYCHHDILLPSFPLCVEWLNFESASAKPGNFCAMGNMTPIIDVWDLDLVNCILPAFQLGRKANKKKKLKALGHTDAVLDLAWNTNFEHVLASGSVDQTVLLWDLETRVPTTTLSNFQEKVQSLQFHLSEAHLLLTGCADKTTKLFDCRTENSFQTWEATGEVERVLWNHFDPNFFFVSTSNGNIECVDVRQKKHVWEVVAHESEVTGLSLSCSCPGLMVSTSNDGVIKVWDTLPDVPELVFEKKMALGAIQCLAACPDSPFVFALGGDNKENNYKAWDLREIEAVAQRFEGRKLGEKPADNEMMEMDDSESKKTSGKSATRKKKKQ